MSGLKETHQQNGGVTTGNTPKGTHGDEKKAGSNASTSGTDRDLDRSGESVNQGHGHPRNDHKQDGE
jgi:hypothetical protein